MSKIHACTSACASHGRHRTVEGVRSPGLGGAGPTTPRRHVISVVNMQPDTMRSEGTMAVTLEDVRTALSTVKDPEIRRPITELGMVGSLTVSGNGVVELTV